MARTLHIFPFSHFSEKAMWILDYKGVRYRALPLASPFFRGKIARITRGSTTLPVLQDGARVVTDSTDIALHLERLQEEPPLIPAREPHRSECLLIENWADEEIGVHSRRWLMGHVLYDDTEYARRLLHSGGIPRLVLDFCWPLVVPGSSWYLSVDRRTTRDSAESLTRIMQILDDKLRGRQFLVGERFTLADLAVCALLFPIANRGPWRNEFRSVFAWRDRLCRLHGRRAAMTDPIPNEGERVRRGRAGARAMAGASAVR